MNSLLLVEDEPLERQALKMELERSDYGISRIYEAANGQEALDIFETENPDILIVDINIPVFSGLDLIGKIRHSGAACKILITTTFDRFKYARTAISLGVTDYLLKPVDYTELKKAIEKCQALLAAECKREKIFDRLYSYSQQHVLEGLLSGELSWSDEDIAGVMDIGPNEELYASLVVCNLEWERFEHEITKRLVSDFALLTACIEESSVAVVHPKGISSREHAAARIRAYMRRLFSELSAYGQISLYCCEPVGKFKDLGEMYKKCVRGMEKEMEKNILLPSMPSGQLCKSSEKARLKQKWLNKLYQRDANRFVSSMKRRIKNEAAYWEGADLLCDVFQKIDKSADLIALFHCFEQEKPYEAVSQFLSCYYTGHIVEFEKKELGIPERIMSILQRDFTQDITQSDVAEEMGMSTSYFSTLFNKAFGNSFTDILNTMRINKAIALIESGETDPEKIAKSCGYTNRKYFLQVFRTRTHKTAAEYMEAVKNERHILS